MAAPQVSACPNCGGPLPEGSAPQAITASGPALGPAGGAGDGATRQPGGLGAHFAEMSGWAGALETRAGLSGSHVHGNAGGHHHGHSRTGASGEGAHGPRDHDGSPAHHRHHGALGFLRKHLVGEAEAVVRAHHPKWQWRAAGGIAVAVLLVLAFLMVKSCALTAPPLSAPPGFTGPAASADVLGLLPESLRAADCLPHSETEGVQSCSLTADSALLAGGITGGRTLVFQVQSASPGPLAQAIAQWRTAGSAVLADGEVFAAVSASSAVWFADTTSGLRVDTGAFANEAGARTFLARSGLLGS
ncbi:hypothetical protein [Nocardia sp. CA-290969]|uniref:hypothetical protein n=1 Tax=Nocardia sp. CA-290969 TaxID=3239986 RepID=UPI003D8E34FE